MDCCLSCSTGRNWSLTGQKSPGGGWGMHWASSAHHLRETGKHCYWWLGEQSYQAFSDAWLLGVGDGASWREVSDLKEEWLWLLKRPSLTCKAYVACYLQCLACVKCCHCMTGGSCWWWSMLTITYIIMHYRHVAAYVLCTKLALVI